MDIAEKLNSQTTLVELVSGLASLPEPVPPELNVSISGVQADSRLLKAGDIFLACFGRNHDAREYIDQAIAAGAVAVLAESGGRWQGISLKGEVPVIAVDNLWTKVSEVAARFYGRPSSKMTVFGITGTNGKTSCSQFLSQVLARLNFKCGVIGTLGYGCLDDLRETRLTTPDAVFTQMALADMLQQGIDPVAMEVSSVGLHQRRVAAVTFDTAIFTNITRDHLDYHGSMEAYAENKKKLFTSQGLRHAVINLDDPYALAIINEIPNEVEISTYSIENSIATVHAKELKLTRGGFEASITTPLGQGRITGRLIGYFNFSNVLAVIAALLSYLPRSHPVDIDALCACISSLEPVNGRMEIVGDSEELTTVVDYAHTPDGLRSALVALKDHFEGEIWCVFGCGGNRDNGKRPLMGEIAEKHADHLVITDDNPRNERGDDIVQHILSGIDDKAGVNVIRDRAQAIDFAVGSAAPGDVVLVAGKGHETYQDIGGNKLMFSDVNQVRLALQKRSG